MGEARVRLRADRGPRPIEWLLALSLVLAGLAGTGLLTHARAATAIIGCDVDRVSALRTALADPEVDTVELTANCTYTLTDAYGATKTGLPEIGRSLTIEGNGATVERSAADGTPEFRLLKVVDGGDLTLSNVTLSGGRSPLLATSLAVASLQCTAM